MELKLAAVRRVRAGESVTAADAALKGRSCTVALALVGFRSHEAAVDFAELLRRD
jgi:hypothetical protein